MTFFKKIEENLKKYEKNSKKYDKFQKKSNKIRRFQNFKTKFWTFKKDFQTFFQKFWTFPNGFLRDFGQKNDVFCRFFGCGFKSYFSAMRFAFIRLFRGKFCEIAVPFFTLCFAKFTISFLTISASLFRGLG